MPWTRCRKLFRTLTARRIPSTIAAFIQPLPDRGGRGGGGGGIRGGGYPGIMGGGGGGVWLGTDDASFSIIAEIISHQAGASKRDSPREPADSLGGQGRSPRSE